MVSPAKHSDLDRFFFVVPVIVIGSAPMKRKKNSSENVQLPKMRLKPGLRNDAQFCLVPEAVFFFPQEH